MQINKPARKNQIIFIWTMVIIVAFYLYIFQGNFILAQVEKIRDLPLALLCAIYLLINCLRGFTLIPVTYTIILGLIFLPVWPAYIITIIGVLVSSSVIYFFSEYLNLGDYFKRNHAAGIARLTETLQKYEMPIIVGWSFFPFTPTDLMCYVCGSLKVDYRKFILGVFIGEGVSCAIYIFAGKDFLLFLTHKIVGL